MRQAEKKLREAAAAFHQAWVEARDDGIDIVWPDTLEALDRLAISDTKEVPAPPKKTTASASNKGADS